MADAGTPPPGGTAVVWFKPTDLRLDDHEPLVRAHSGHSHPSVLHVLVLDSHPRRGVLPTARSAYGPAKVGPRRFRWLLEGVADLRARLRAGGSELVVRVGDPAEELAKLCGEVAATAVYTHDEVCPEEQAVLTAVAAVAPCPLHRIWGGQTLVHVDDLPCGRVSRLPDVYTFFRKEVEGAGGRATALERYMPAPAKLKPSPAVRDVGGIPAFDADATSAHPHTAVPFVGGESAALARVSTYFSAVSPLPHTYKETRNQMLGPDYSTKFALWLGSGAVSPRRILCELAKFEAEAGETRSSYWIWFELLWRDFFRFQCSKVGTRAFHVGGPRGVTGIAWKNDAGLFEAWRRGRTGYPLVDASMVELNSTGFMSNRSRQIVASFLAKDMGVDWRLGAAHFEETLIDYDCPANWGNWAYGAGVGCDPREDRYFSIPKQGKVYDSEAAYIRTWLPAIAHLPTSQLLGGSRLDVDPDVYPPPVVPLKFGGGRGGGGGYAGRGRGGKDRAQSKQARGGAGEPEGGRGFSATPKERKGKSRNRVQGGW